MISGGGREPLGCPLQGGRLVEAAMTRTKDNRRQTTKEILRQDKEENKRRSSAQLRRLTSLQILRLTGLQIECIITSHAKELEIIL